MCVTIHYIIHYNLLLGLNMHTPVNYMIGITRVISNPRGYVGQEDTSHFDSNFTFEV